MISAILQILVLLSVSCLIGIYFTRRYWQSKLNEHQEASTAHISKISLLEKGVAEKENRISSLEDELAAAQKPKPTKKVSTTEKPSKELKQLKDKIELLEEELGEKERELEDVSKQLEKSKVSYYKQIDGKRYKAITLLAADEAVEGIGDGRISMEDAKKVFATISDGKSYTQVEKDTLKYIRDQYNWTEAADELFRTKVRSWAAKGHELN